MSLWVTRTAVACCVTCALLLTSMLVNLIFGVWSHLIPSAVSLWSVVVLYSLFGASFVAFGVAVVFER